MEWNPFTHGATTYDLAHLHNLEFDLVQPARKDKPERIYPITVEFSLHCFAKTTKAGDDPSLAYSDSRETRTFCFERYALSHQLPAIMRSLDARICRHTRHGNFVTIDLTLQSGEHVEYEVYFAPSKTTADGKKRIKLYVQSAYVRDEESADYRPRPVNSRKIKIHTIAHNTLHNKPIKN